MLTKFWKNTTSCRVNDWDSDPAWFHIFKFFFQHFGGMHISDWHLVCQSLFYSDHMLGFRNRSEGVSPRNKKVYFALFLYTIIHYPFIDWVFYHSLVKFEVNQTKIKGGCQSGIKLVPHYSKSDLPLVWIIKNNIYLPPTT